jgi:hypothetical protein
MSHRRRLRALSDADLYVEIQREAARTAEVVRATAPTSERIAALRLWLERRSWREVVVTARGETVQV